MKRFLLTAGKDFHPELGDLNWIESFDSIIEAKNTIKENHQDEWSYDRYTINNKDYDWYKIIDTDKW